MYGAQPQYGAPYGVRPGMPVYGAPPGMPAYGAAGMPVYGAPQSFVTPPAGMYGGQGYGAPAAPGFPPQQCAPQAPPTSAPPGGACSKDPWATGSFNMS
jgi:hypothetical protein